MTGRLVGFAVIVALLVPSPALPCSLCPGQKAQTLRQEAAQATLVLYGNLANPRLKLNDPRGGGTTELHIESVLKSDPILNGRKMIELPHYIPSDPKSPAKFLLFCNVISGKLDPYRGLPVKAPALIDYLRGAMTRDARDRPPDLAYFFGYLDNSAEEIAGDAFLEFAKASDEHIGRVAPKLAPAKLRSWLQDPKTPPERLGLYAYLLGACGSDQDARMLREMLLERPTERTRAALGGYLAGYIQLQPRDGWDLAVNMLRDERRPFLERLSLIGTLRFYQGYAPKESRTNILRATEVLLPQGDIADLAIEDLRRWQWWELTAQVLAQFSKKTHDAPIMRRAIVRYALSSPQPEVQSFLADVRKQDPDLYQDVKESLQFEKPN
jgi:hypothetical protein